MATQQLSAHFWTLRDDVIIPDCDLGAFKYQMNKDGDLLSGPYGQLKRTLCQSRDKITTPSNKRPSRLRDNLLEFEDLLANHMIAHVGWSVTDYGLGLIVFSNGFIVHLTVDLHQTDVIDIIIDKSLEGKLLADIVGVCSSSELLVIAHGIPQLTIIATNQPVFNTVRPSYLNQCNVTVNSVQLPGPGTRRQERKISLSPQNTTFCLWWEREGGELFAWAPVVRAEDRANILVYSISSELIACHYTEHNPFLVEFSAKDNGQLRVAELLSSAKGRLSVHYTVFNVQQPFKPIQRRLLRIPALPRCHSHSPDEQILLLGCVDASIIAWDVTRDTITTIKSSFIPFHLSWHGESAFFTVCGERGQLQCWDRALNPLLLRLQRGTDGSPVLHLQQYLRHQPSVLALKWAALPDHLSSLRESPVHNTATLQFRLKSTRSIRKKSRSPAVRDVGQYRNNTTRTAAQYLLVCFERGPILCLQFLTSCWPGGCSLDSLSICSEYLLWQQLEAAVQHLLSLKWTNVRSFYEEDVLLSCLVKVVNGLLHQPNPVADNLLERVIINLLGTVRGDDALAEPVFDAARRCCRAMFRRGRLQLAAVYALRVQDPDLLIELVLHARNAGDEALVSQATTVLDCVRDEFSSTSSSTRSSRSSSYISSSSSDTSESCSTCDESHSTHDDPSHQLSNLNLEDNNEDQVHVISFGVV
ncbi:WD repeat-containing and planar cell polarity effector protein fritz-like [Daphnia carinata]|uniref:WD repeat-containing and planar cell polarity effector protein fritz-like n=1 Tax=Daphnia carinata TaxID=120202 RepID=UPI0025808A39|nr:WD repeat-containing and planar cell polarity effector protein fritz-like [Daphnia carinata]